MGNAVRRRKCSFWRLIAILLAGLLLAPAAVILPLRWLDPPVSAMMLEYRYGMRPPRPVVHHWTAWKAISPWAPLAVMASEDQKFPRHFGFDFDSIADALDARGERLRGASTISQQTAKNLFLWPGRSFVRKGLEAWLTLYLEGLLDKRRILELYLNIAEFGRGIYGIGAASETFFGKPAAALSAREAALLAAVLPNPRRLSAASPSDYVRRRADWIQSQVPHLDAGALFRRDVGR